MKAIYNLKDIQYLSIYVIAEEWEKESGISINIWLHRMAKDILSPDVQPLIVLGGQLKKGQKAIPWLLDGVRSSLPDRLAKDLDEVRITRECFQLWCESKSYPLPKFWFPNNDESNEPNQQSIQKQTPEEIRDNGKRNCWEDVLIAKAILDKYPTIKHFELGKLLPANPGSTIAKESTGKRGQRLKQAVKEKLQRAE